MTDDLPTRGAAADNVPLELGPWDVVEARYVGGCPEMPSGRSQWRCIGIIDEIPILLLHWPAVDLPACRHATPVTELAEVVKLGSLADG